MAWYILNFGKTTRTTCPRPKRRKALGGVIISGGMLKAFCEAVDDYLETRKQMKREQNI
jgi:hypothetical protein